MSTSRCLKLLIYVTVILEQAYTNSIPNYGIPRCLNLDVLLSDVGSSDVEGFFLFFFFFPGAGFFAVKKE